MTYFSIDFMLAATALIVGFGIGSTIAGVLYLWRFGLPEGGKND